MKNFFSDPFNLAWSIGLGLVFVLGIVCSFVDVLYRLELFLIGAECVYSAVLLIRFRRKNHVNIEDFQNQPDDQPEKKKFSFAKSESKINMVLLIGSLFFVGAILMYFTFRI